MSGRAWGRGLVTLDSNGAVLDAWYPDLGLGEPVPAVAIAGRESAERHDEVRGVDISPVEMTIDIDAPPASADDLYLRLHLLSSRLCKPRTINLDGLFGLLSNVAWTNIGPIAVDQ
ncbi:MAG TPA: 2,3,4,5-tetrahydropyridine-2,6-dicarboxylate N-succinyltransferase, partial [Ilumatobacteraceae bacterium]|nr:2,3,4,5-tetrahydropyridine-2,6-dicarboxylate N-succinyltransferase [Ilumatobacteraceae bacterium]